MYVADRRAYVHTFFGNVASSNKHQAISNSVLQFLSVVPFWCGEYGADFSLCILFSIINAWNSLEVNSVPLSLLSHLILPNGAQSDKIVWWLPQLFFTSKNMSSPGLRNHQ